MSVLRDLLYKPVLSMGSGAGVVLCIPLFQTCVMPLRTGMHSMMPLGMGTHSMMPLGMGTHSIDRLSTTFDFTHEERITSTSREKVDATCVWGL